MAVALALAPAQSALAGEGPTPGPPPASATTPPAAGLAAPTAPAAAAPAEVQSLYVTADGIAHGTDYLAAPGVSATQLYSTLKARGVKNLVAPSSGTGIVPLTGSCGYGTASNINGTCPPVTWARNGFTNPQIYYRDTTGSSWPVATVLGEWNDSPNIHVAWAPSGCPGTAGTHCVIVNEGYDGVNGIPGTTYYSYNTSTHHFVDGSVSIHFNDSYTANHRALACNETGKSIGLGRNTSSSSCMYNNPSGTWPVSDDYNEILHQLYP
ncbi:hypothetical protein [Streptacidiphilus sp. PAMC 29251]